MVIGIGSATISDHARAAMARREIAEVELRQVLQAPAAWIAGNRPGRWVAQAPITLGEPPRRVLLRVVVDLDQNPPEVVTVYATTQFGRYGAK